MTVVIYATYYVLSISSRSFLPDFEFNRFMFDKINDDVLAEIDPISLKKVSSWGAHKY